MISEPTPDRFHSVISDVEQCIIASQNDLFRRGWPKRHVPGRFILQPSISERSGAFQLECIEAVRRFEDFPSDGDAARTRASGAFELNGEMVRFNISLLDTSYGGPSPQPDDVEQTRRILTVFLDKPDTSRAMEC